MMAAELHELPVAHLFAAGIADAASAFSGGGFALAEDFGVEVRDVLMFHANSFPCLWAWSMRSQAI